MLTPGAILELRKIVAGRESQTDWALMGTFGGFDPTGFWRERPTRAPPHTTTRYTAAQKRELSVNNLKTLDNIAAACYPPRVRLFTRY